MVSKKLETEAKRCASVRKQIDDCQSQSSLIKRKWMDNYDMFTIGTVNVDKEEWQSQFCVNKLETSTRVAQGRLVNILVNNPNWYELCPRSDYNDAAQRLSRTFKKIMDYYLESAKFKRHAGAFFLTSLISCGSQYIGWKQRLVQNPEYILKKTEKERRRIQQRLAKNVVNPQVDVSEELSGEAMETELSRAIDEFVAEAQGDGLPEEKIEQYIQIGCLDLMDINPERFYWDPNVMYMEDSRWKAFDYDINKWELNQFAKLGFFSKSAVKRVGDQGDYYTIQANQRLRYQQLQSSATSRSDMVKITVYSGPLIIDEEVVQDKYFAIIANGTVILRDGEYPFWEPPGDNTPIVTAAVRQVPFRATGAGLGDSATQLQRMYDSNWQLVCDTFRFGISGLNVVNYQALVDKSQLEEGIYPGMTLQVRTEPQKAFQHISLTDNIENQAHPVQAMLEQAIDSLTGINELMIGGGNQYSRTSAAETNARLSAGNEQVNIIALDLEQQFLIPALNKVFARILQFGLGEINTNPELAALLNEEELYELQQMTASDRMDILNQWYTFKIEGFSYAQDRNEQLQRWNELLQIASSGGPLGQLINMPELLKSYFKLANIKEPERLLLINDSPLKQVTDENGLLLSGHLIIPSPNDNHEFHIQNHQALAQSPYATPEMQSHLQYHVQFLQQMQAEQQMQGSEETIQ